MDHPHPTNLEERHAIEETFHDEWAKSITTEDLLVRESFEAITAMENRFALQQMDPASIKGKKVLDLGCGAGETTVYFSLLGADVVGVDLSQEMLEVAQRLSSQYQAPITTIKSVAETLPFPDNHFDFVFGNGILHHVDYKLAVKEVSRILKPTGLAVFIEPLSYNPAIQMYRKIAESVRTPTERPFKMKDLRTMKDHFKSVTHREFWFTTLLVFVYYYLKGDHPSKVRYWKKVIQDADQIKGIFRILNALDSVLLTIMPWFRYWCWNTVMVLRNPVKP